jgi:predicted nucleic acid-binding protein
VDIVIDTSVLVAVVANEPEKARLIRLTEGADLIAPYSVHWEVGNAFSAMLRRKRITLTEALRAIEAYRQIPIRFVEVELEESLEIAQSWSSYAYDAYLLRCAAKYNAPLLTLDQVLLDHARRMQLPVIEVE